MTRKFLSLSALVLCLAAVPAMAQNGRIQIPFASPVVTPIVITAPGSYVVTRNLLPTGPGPIINVAVPLFPGGDVTLDLNGMLLDNSPNPIDPVILVSFLGSSEVTIRNGALVGGTSGIDATGPGIPGRKLVIEDVKVSDFTSIGGTIAGIEVVDVTDLVIRRCVIMDGPGGPGIFYHGGLPRQATIVDNHIQRTADGIDTIPFVNTLEISNNRINDIFPGGVFGAAINLDGASSCIVSQNTINFVAGAVPPFDGTWIRLGAGSEGCKVYNNTIVGAAGHGIHLPGGSDGNLLLNNVIRRCGGDGMFIEGSENHLVENTSTANAGFGLRLGVLSFDNHLRRNMAVGNGGGPSAVCPVPMAFWSPDFCDGPNLVFPMLTGPNWTFGDNMMPGAFPPI